VNSYYYEEEGVLRSSAVAISAGKQLKHGKGESRCRVKEIKAVTFKIWRLSKKGAI
jgi:hypothetical protein